MDVRTGGCNCGAVRFTAEGDLRPVIYCHCSQCRRQTGHYYACTNLPAAKLSIEGEDEITWYAASPQGRRGFCRHCGSALFWREIGADDISVMAGVFDGAPGLVGGSHIFVADKGDYYEIDDGLPDFAAWPPAGEPS